MPDPHSPLTQASVDLFNISLAISVAICLLVTGLLLYSIVASRRRGDFVPARDYGNRRLEIAWTVAPALVLVGVLVFMLPRLRAQEVETSKDPQRGPDVIVVGHQWWWEIRYPTGNVVTANEIHLPTGQRWLVRLDGADVIHNVWIPQLGPKMDAVPGQTNWMWLEASSPGTYPGACAEYCGVEHAWMLLRAVAQTPADFAQWLTAEGAAAAAPTAIAVNGNPVRGAQLFSQRTCISCHAIGGTAAVAVAGPNLTHFASRTILAAGVLDNTPANVARWLRNPQEVKPGNHMPNLRLSDDEVRDLTAYMETLR